MRAPIRSAALTGLAFVVGGKCQRAGTSRSAQNAVTAIRASRWADAQAAAARFADPVAEKLVLYFRLRAPGAATAAEIADFMQRNPDWPAQAMLEQRRQEAIAKDPDDADVLVQCAADSPGVAAPVAASPLSRPSTASACCAVRRLSPTPAAAPMPMRCPPGLGRHDRRPPPTETSLPPPLGRRRHRRRPVGSVSAPGLADHRGRRSPGRPPRPAHHAAAEARLAVKRDDPKAEALVAALPPALHADPGLMLDRARALRREDRPTDARAVWLNRRGERRKYRSRPLGEFWAERNVLARKLLQVGDGSQLRPPMRLVADHGQTADEVAARRRIPCRLHRPSPAA